MAEPPLAQHTGYVLIYSGGTAEPAGWTAVGGLLQYDGTEVWAEPTVTEIATTHDNDLDGSLDVSELTGLLQLACYGNLITGLILPDTAALVSVDANTNALTSVTIHDVDDGGAVYLGDNALSESEVDAILVALAAGAAINGTLDLTNGTNAPPSATGLTAKGTLEGRGWTVTVNS